MGKPRVMIIDDEPALSRLLSMHLQQHGYDVKEASAGPDSLAAARAFHPQVILLDVIMPELGGIELAHQFRADPALRAVPLMFLSASVMKDELEEEVVDLINGFPFLVKPVSVEVILEHLEQSLRKHMV